MEANESHKIIRRKVTGMRQSLYSNSIWISGEREANYLMSGHATELLDTISLSFSDSEKARVYGVVAADRSKGRYVWIYLFCFHHLWHCHSISDAYKIVEKIKAYRELQMKENKLFNKMLLERRKELKRKENIKSALQNVN